MLLLLKSKTVKSLFSWISFVKKFMFFIYLFDKLRTPLTGLWLSSVMKLRISLFLLSSLYIKFLVAAFSLLPLKNTFYTTMFVFRLSTKFFISAWGKEFVSMWISVKYGWFFKNFERKFRLFKPSAFKWMMFFVRSLSDRSSNLDFKSSTTVS